jgi:glucan phosphoethanolaminetransferase (alkaline phosphatase superfamily)
MVDGMSKHHFFVVPLCVLALAIFLSWLYNHELRNLVYGTKSIAVFVGLIGATLAAFIEFTIIVIKHTGGSVSNEDTISNYVKLITAVSLFATVWASAEDLSGDNDKRPSGAVATSKK